MSAERPSRKPSWPRIADQAAKTFIAAREAHHLSDRSAADAPLGVLAPFDGQVRTRRSHRRTGPRSSGTAWYEASRCGSASGH